MLYSRIWLVAFLLMFVVVVDSFTPQIQQPSLLLRSTVSTTTTTTTPGPTGTQLHMSDEISQESPEGKSDYLRYF